MDTIVRTSYLIAKITHTLTHIQTYKKVSVLEAFLLFTGGYIYHISCVIYNKHHVKKIRIMRIPSSSRS